jgi:hypothetical protein
MSDYDPLELELAAMRPRLPSPELKRRIADQLVTTISRRTNDSTSVWRGGLLVGGLLAASLAAVFVWHDGDRQTPTTPFDDLDITTAFDTSLPSLWSYHRLLSQRPDPIESLFAGHAFRTLEPTSGDSAFALARANFDVETSNGDL